MELLFGWLEKEKLVWRRSLHSLPRSMPLNAKMRKKQSLASTGLLKFVARKVARSWSSDAAACGSGGGLDLLMLFRVSETIGCWWGLLITQRDRSAIAATWLSIYPGLTFAFSWRKIRNSAIASGFDESLEVKVQ